MGLTRSTETPTTSALYLTYSNRCRDAHAWNFLARGIRSRDSRSPFALSILQKCSLVGGCRPGLVFFCVGTPRSPLSPSASLTALWAVRYRGPPSTRGYTARLGRPSLRSRLTIPGVRLSVRAVPGVCLRRQHQARFRLRRPRSLRSLERRTRNRLVCWPLAPGSPGARGWIFPSRKRARSRPKGRSKARAARKRDVSVGEICVENRD